MTKSYTKIIIHNNVRIYLSDYKDIVQKILDYHKYPPFPNLILSNIIAAYLPLKFLYNSQNMSVKYKTNGPIKAIILETKNNDVRALVADPNIETEYDKNNYNNIPLILGIGDKGYVQISRIINNETFTSEVPLARADVVSDAAYYLNHSDQVFSAILNNVKLDEKKPNKIKVANNVIFQLLPGHSEEDLEWIETFIKQNNFNEIDINEYEERIKGTLLSINEVFGKCWCNKQKLINAISMLSIKEKDELFNETNNIESICDFCETKYIINVNDV